MLDAAPLWVIFLGTVAAIILAEECGYGLGRVRLRRHPERESDSLLGGMVAAELGLLAFLLAFTFGIAASRFDARRQVVLDEANAIGTAYLRVAILPEAHRATLRRLLAEYTDVRIAGVGGHMPLDEAIQRSEDLQTQLWSEAVEAADKSERPALAALFIQALNDVIDLHAKRITAGLRSRIPMAVWLVLYGVALLAFIAVGYQNGLTGKARSPAVMVVALTFAAVVWLVADLDRPAEGALRASQQPMIDARKAMEPR